MPSAASVSRRDLSRTLDCPLFWAAWALSPVNINLVPLDQLQERVNRTSTYVEVLLTSVCYVLNLLNIIPMDEQEAHDLYLRFSDVHAAAKSGRVSYLSFEALKAYACCVEQLRGFICCSTSISPICRTGARLQRLSAISKGCRPSRQMAA